MRQRTGCGLCVVDRDRCQEVCSLEDTQIDEMLKDIIFSTVAAARSAGLSVEALCVPPANDSIWPFVADSRQSQGFGSLVVEHCRSIASIFSMDTSSNAEMVTLCCCSTPRSILPGPAG